MPFIDLPVDILLSVAGFLSYVEIASLVRVNKSLAHLLLPYLYNPILRSVESPKNPYYGLPWVSWMEYVGRWHSPLMLNYLNEAPTENLLYSGLHNATLIHLAASQNNSDVFGILLRKGLGLEQKDLFGRTPLHYALQFNQGEMVNNLLNAGADVMTKRGYSLLLAAEKCSPDIVVRIVERMDALEERFKPFQFTGFSMDNTVQIIKDLALNAATVRGSREISRLLIRYGAHPDWESGSEVPIQIFKSWIVAF